MPSVTRTKLKVFLPLVASGKVRDIYELDGSTLLFVATDRISGRSAHAAQNANQSLIWSAAYDVILDNDVDQKGAILTQLSLFWFKMLQIKIPALQTHLVSSGIPSHLKQRLPSSLAADLEPRSMVVKKVRVLPIESIVRGYITGSAWSSYLQNGTVCGIPLPSGLKESQKLGRPLWTPSTKAKLGDKDENISPEEGA